MNRRVRHSMVAFALIVMCALTLPACADWGGSCNAGRGEDLIRTRLAYEADAPKTGILEPCDSKLIYNRTELIDVEIPDTFFYDGAWRVRGLTAIGGERSSHQIARGESTMLTIRSVEDVEQAVITLDFFDDRLKPQKITEEVCQKALGADHYCIKHTATATKNTC